MIDLDPDLAIDIVIKIKNIYHYNIITIIDILPA